MVGMSELLGKNGTPRAYFRRGRIAVYAVPLAIALKEPRMLQNSRSQVRHRSVQ